MELTNERIKLKQANKGTNKQILRLIIKLPVNLPCLLIVTKFRINAKISRQVTTAWNKKFPPHPFIFRCVLCINALVSLYSASDIFSGSRSRGVTCVKHGVQLWQLILANVRSVQCLTILHYFVFKKAVL